MKYFKLLPLLIVAILFSGCFDLVENYIINPDGSGKVNIEARFYGMNYLMKHKEPDVLEKITEKDMKFDVGSLFIGAFEGFDAWKDITYEALDDGRIHLKATGYFKDINNITIGSNPGVIYRKLHHIYFNSDKDKLSLELSDTKGGFPRDRSKITQLTDEEIEVKVQERKDKISKKEPSPDQRMTNYKLVRNFTMPGTVASSSNLKLNDDGQLSFTYDKVYLEKLTQMREKDEYLRLLVKDINNMIDSTKLENYQNAYVLGEEAPIQASYTGKLKPLFNYEKEMEAAKKEYEVFTADMNASFEK